MLGHEVIMDDTEYGDLLWYLNWYVYTYFLFYLMHVKNQPTL